MTEHIDGWITRQIEEARKSIREAPAWLQASLTADAVRSIWLNKDSVGTLGQEITMDDILRVWIEND